MGSWKRTITSPFRKACTILSPQHGGGARSDDQNHSGNGGGNDGKKTPRTRHHLKRSGAAAAAAAMAQGDVVESPSTTAQLYGDVMACAYEDVQVMWSMLDNKSKVLDTAAS